MSKVDWKKRSKKTQKIIKSIWGDLKAYKRQLKKDCEITYYFSDYPPKLFLIAIFYGYNLVSDSMLDKLTDMTTMIGKAGLSRCRKYKKFNEAHFTFMLPFENGENNG